MSSVKELVSELQTIAPLKYAAEWDNVGLLVGSTEWDCENVLLTIDLTPAVLREAMEAGMHAIIAYHPPIFAPLKSITDRSVKESIILDAARQGIAIYAPHTALDAAPGGVNDWLAEACGKGDVRALEAHAELPSTEQVKIVTFAPAESADAIRNGMATAGAGMIGEYSACSFEIPGSGTFLAGDATNPTVGKRGVFERASEVRLEMVCSRDALALALVALRQFHPYEEPPIDVYELIARPMRTVGMGRRITLDRGVTLKTITQRMKAHLGVRQLRVAQGDDTPRTYRTIGLCAGAGGSMLNDAIRQGCELFITGEMRHHDVLDATSRGCSVILAGHTHTERGYLKVLAKRLRGALSDVEFTVSKSDRSPWRSM